MNRDEPEQLTKKMMDDIVEELREVKQPAQMVMLSAKTYDTLAEAYAANDESMPFWLIRIGPSTAWRVAG